MRDKFSAIEAKLDSLPTGVIAVDKDSIENKFRLAMFLMIALLCPFISAEFSRQLGLLHGTKTVPTVPSQGTIKEKRGTEKRTWDDKQHQKLENAWRKLENDGVKITLDALQKESGVSRSLCSLYKRGGGPKNLPVKGKVLSFTKKD